MLLAIPCLSLLAVFSSPAAADAAATLRIDFIDVGQGDAALITSPTGKTMLIDGGPRKSSGTLVAFLEAHTRGPLDLVLLSHRHEDHLGGLVLAIREIGAHLFLDAATPNPGPAYTALMQALRAGHVAVRQADRGRVIDLGAGALMTLLGPPDPPIFGSRSDVNANSVVARLTYGSFSVLFTGDAETQTETWLLSSGVDLSSVVLKVAHHGSRYASKARFLEAVGAKVAVISVGAANEYGHPAPPTLARLARRQTTVYRTDMEGNVTLETDGTSLQIHTARGRNQTMKSPQVQ